MADSHAFKNSCKVNKITRLIGIVFLFSLMELFEKESTSHWRSSEWNELLFTQTRPRAKVHRITACRRSYFLARIPHSTNGISRLVMSGDIHSNPGPRVQKPPKYPCKKCGKNIGNNHEDAILSFLCATCDVWSHAKCLKMSKSSFKYYLQHLDIDWIRPLCMLEKQKQMVAKVHELDIFNFSESFFEHDDKICITESMDESSRESPPRVNEFKRKDARNILIIHLNVNSLQNKFEEVSSLMKEFKAQVIYLTETKIDASYPNSQFMVEGYNIYRYDRVISDSGVF